MTQQFVQTPKTTAKDLEALLRSHYVPETKPPAGLFATEIQDPTGHRRADVLWVPMTSAARGQIVCHEIKVTRADVVTELSDPTKADAWLRYCHQFWLVIPHRELIEGLAVPVEWGVMTPPTGRLRRSMTVVRPAAQLKPVNPAPALAVITAWMFYRFGEQRAELARVKSIADTAKAAEANYAGQIDDLQRKLDAGGDHPFYTVRALLDRMAQLEQAKTLDWRHMPSPEDLALTLRDLTAARAEENRIRQTLQRAGQDTGRLARLLKEAHKAIDVTTRRITATGDADS